MCVENVQHPLLRFLYIVWQQVDGVYAFQRSEAIFGRLASVEFAVQDFNKEIPVAAGRLQECGLWSKDIFVRIIILEHVAHLLDDKARGVNFPVLLHSVFAFC